MFLITTADQKFWKTKGKILFLGEWCKLFSKKASWEHLSYEVLPYHWDDRQKLYKDYLYLNRIYEHILSQLANQLNKLHAVDHSLRYWRIIIGPWLYFFINIFFDRYQSILKAEKSGKVTHTIIGKYDKTQWVLRDNLELARYFDSDEYNHFLFSQIIERKKKIPFDRLNVTSGIHKIEIKKSPKKSTSFSFKEFLKKLIRGYSCYIPNYFNRVILVSSALYPKDQFRLQLSMGQLPYFPPPVILPPESKLDFDFRAKLTLRSCHNKFEKMLAQMIQEQMPSVYLEGYHEMNQRALNVYPKKPRLIFTSISFEVDEGFKFWSAYHVDHGCKFVESQHGSNYGLNLWNQEEEHQIKIFDKFYTWGWQSDKHKNTKPLSAAKFNIVKSVVKPKYDGRILMTTFAFPRFAYKMFSVPVSSTGMISYLNDQFNFVRSLTDEVRKLLLVRLFPNDRNWNQIERWSQEFPEIEYYKGYSISMFNQMNESRLLVTAPNGTPCLEAFVANFPTVLLWNPNHFELRPSAQPYYDVLRQAGILHDNTESAAAKMNEIYHDTKTWWQQPEIQEAKNKFCSRFARTSKNWMKEWRMELFGLAKVDKQINGRRQ